MKEHTTVTITRKWLLENNACRDGFDAVAPLLPAKLSTDPERNLKLACEIADTEYARAGGDAVWWLLSFARCACLPDDALLVGTYYHTELDAWIIAQYLAWVADYFATGEGR